MITLFTTLKPFTGANAVIQRNALQSWRRLSDGVDIMVFGRSEGLEEVVTEFGLRHYSDVSTIGPGIPRVDAMFEVAQREGAHDLQAYLNGDMVMGPDFLDALQSIPLPRFLLTGQRWNTRAFSGTDIGDETSEGIRSRGLSQGELFCPWAMDYFGYRRGSLQGLPPLVPGAILWDNHMIMHCRQARIPVIDATHDVLALHQDHGYERTEKGARVTNEGLMAENNRHIADGVSNNYSVLDASHVLIQGHLRPFWMSFPHLCYQLLMQPRRKPSWLVCQRVSSRLSRNLDWLTHRIRPSYARAITSLVPGTLKP